MRIETIPRGCHGDQHVNEHGVLLIPLPSQTLGCTAPERGAPYLHHYVTSMATVLSAILFSAGASWS